MLRGSSPSRLGAPAQQSPAEGKVSPINTPVLIHDLDKFRIGIFRRLFACGS